jgi:hypothetical protein
VGNLLCLRISELPGTHGDELLSLSPLRAEIIEPQMAFGLEAMAMLTIREDTLKVGVALVCGMSFGRVRSMLNELLEKRSMAVKILGLSGFPKQATSLRSSKTIRLLKKNSKNKIEMRPRVRRDCEMRLRCNPRNHHRMCQWAQKQQNDA